MSLFELLTALSVAAILAGAATATSRRHADRLAVEAVQGNVLNAYRRAQSAARAWARPAELTVSADSIVLKSVGRTDTTELWRVPGPARAGVVLTPATHVVTFGANGLAMGVASMSHQLQKGSSLRVVIVSRLGRVRTR